MLHPNTIDDQDLNPATVFRAIDKFSNKVVCFYPNNDFKNSDIVKEIRLRSQYIKFSHIPMFLFVKLLAHSACVIGNSSAGIREAASFGIPVVNIGDRQKGRERNENVLDVACDLLSIDSAIAQALDLKVECKNIYGDGKAVSRIIDVIKKYNKLDYKNICLGK